MEAVRVRFARLRAKSLVIVGVMLLAALPQMVMRGEPAHALASCPDGTGYGGLLTSSTDRSISNGGNGCLIIQYSGGTDILVHTGAIQNWTVPAGVTSITLHLIGAGGGAGLQNRGGSQGGDGGGGGYATGVLTVTPGTTYNAIVGGGGRYMCTSDAPENLTLTQRRNYSFGGGAAGYGGSPWDCSWASGGGRTALRTASGVDDIITAGGGGGGGYWLGHGGAGGGTSGQDGESGSRGTGGTQVAGGLGGISEDGYDGIQYEGGPAGKNTGSASEGGGGGGGYFGGGGAGNNSGGGGGSSYIGTLRGLQSGSTQGGNRRSPGAVAPTNSVVPTISGTARVGSMLTATTGTWNGATSKSFRWQVSTNNSTWTDISGEIGGTYVVGVVGYVRVVETSSNFFGTTSANSIATSLITDTTLSSLSVSTGTLSPSFSAGVFSYAVSVPYLTTSIKVTATRGHSSTTLTIGGSVASSGVASSAISLATGSNTINVVATNTGVSTTTAIVVTRAAPATPTAPTITSVTAGDKTLSIAFSTPTDDGGEPINNYEYSLNAGTWVSMNGTVSPFQVSSLTNGVTYAVRVRAVSSVGSGSASVSVSGTPVSRAVATTTTTTAPKPATTTTVAVDLEIVVRVPAGQVNTTLAPVGQIAIPTVSSVAPGATFPKISPTTTVKSTTTTLGITTTTLVVPKSASAVAPKIPSLDTGEAAVTSGGKNVSTRLTRENNQIVIQAAGITTTINGLSESGAQAPLNKDGNVPLQGGSRVRVFAEGFKPNSIVEAWLFSTPTWLGNAKVDEKGTLSQIFTLPKDVKPGQHRIALKAITAAGDEVSIALGIVVGDGKIARNIAPWLIAIPIGIAMAVAFFLPVAYRRRREDEEEALRSR